MRRFLSLLALLLALTLAGCGADGGEQRAEQLQQLYGALQGYTAEAAVDLSREEETLHYRLRVEKDAEKSRITVLAPETLSGIAATIADETLSLEYDGMVLDAGAPGSSVSAVNCVPLLLAAFPESYVAVREETVFSGRDALRVGFETKLGEQTLFCTLYFSDENAPLYAQIAENEKIIAFAEFTSFSFGDILSSDAQEKSS